MANNVKALKLAIGTRHDKRQRSSCPIVHTSSTIITATLLCSRITCVYWTWRITLRNKEGINGLAAYQCTYGMKEKQCKTWNSKRRKNRDILLTKDLVNILLQILSPVTGIFCRALLTHSNGSISTISTASSFSMKPCCCSSSHLLEADTKQTHSWQCQCLLPIKTIVHVQMAQHFMLLHIHCKLYYPQPFHDITREYVA